MKYSWFLILILYSYQLSAQQPYHPFPQHVQYFAGTIKPNHITQQQLDKATENFYTQWRSRFIKTGKNGS